MDGSGVDFGGLARTAMCVTMKTVNPFPLDVPDAGFFRALVALALLGAGMVVARPVQADALLLQQLQDTVRLQQEQLRKQAETLEALQEQINLLKQAAAQPTAPTTVLRTASGREPATPPSTTADKERFKVSISGQVHRALNFTNDGKSTESYFVDHASSGSRINLVTTASLDDLLLGSRIEVAIAPDNSAQVSQASPASGDTFNQRWTEVSLQSAKWGKLSLGKGDTASNTTSEVDLSGTLPIQNSSVADLHWGMLFRERMGNRALSNIRVSNGFSNLDGLHRESRIRYDTPLFYGARLAASTVSNQRSDVALFWNGQGYGLRAAGAAAISNPNLDKAGNRYNGSFSILHPRSGLNLTLSAGSQARDGLPSDANLYGKLGWLAKLNRLGNTAFVIDYTRSKNMPSTRDEGQSIGAGVVQHIERLDTELYLLYRRYSLDRYSGAPVSDIRAGSLGARVRF